MVKHVAKKKKINSIFCSYSPKILQKKSAKLIWENCAFNFKEIISSQSYCSLMSQFQSQDRFILKSYLIWCFFLSDILLRLDEDSLIFSNFFFPPFRSLLYMTFSLLTYCLLYWDLWTFFQDQRQMFLCSLEPPGMFLSLTHTHSRQFKCVFVHSLVYSKCERCDHILLIFFCVLLR